MNCHSAWHTVLSLVALAAPATAANRFFPHNLVLDLPGIADQHAEQLINPWDFVSSNSCMPVNSPSCVPPNVSSVLISTNGNATITLHANGSLASSVLPGETVALFGNGFGPIMPSVPNGQLLSSPLPLIQPAQVTIGNQPASVSFVGLVGPGLYQVNVVVPAVDPKYRFFGTPVVMSIAGAAVQASGFIEYDWPAIP